MNILHVENNDFSIKMIVDRLEAIETRIFDATLTVRVITSSLHLYCHGDPYDFTFSYLNSFYKQLKSVTRQGWIRRTKQAFFVDDYGAFTLFIEPKEDGYRLNVELTPTGAQQCYNATHEFTLEDVSKFEQQIKDFLLLYT